MDNGIDPASALAACAADHPRLGLRRDVPWGEVTTLGAGAAPIPLLAEPRDEDALAAVLACCAKARIPIFALGSGSNLVGRDTPQPGLVLRLGDGFAGVEAAKGRVMAGAAARLGAILRAAAQAGLGGLAPLAAIPGSLGGALRMNAGAQGLAIASAVALITGRRRDGSPWQAAGDAIVWGERISSIPSDVTVTAAVLALQPVDPREELAAIEAALRDRAQRDPRGRSAGCAFRNPLPSMPAGRLLDQAGAKGLQVGDAALSDRHANWLMNHGAASEAEVVDLLCQARRRVADQAGVLLSLEAVFADPAAAARIAGSPAPLRVAVLKGGTSSERPVSLESGTAVANALRIAGHDVAEIDLQDLALPPEAERADVVFPVLHGGFGENGEIQALLAAAGLPFVGCDADACRIVFDKIPSKQAMDRAGIPTAPWAILGPGDRELPPGLALPVVVKPPTEGSTVGISLVFAPEEWAPALALARRSDPERILVEQYIGGREITVGILGGEALPLVEIQFPGKTYDYDAKYTHAAGETRYHCPPVTIPADVQARAQAVALAFAQAVGARDMLRVDMIVRHGDDALFVLEANNIPGFTASSLLPKAARARGIEFPELCGRLVQMAWRRSLEPARRS